MDLQPLSAGEGESVSEVSAGASRQFTIYDLRFTNRKSSGRCGQKLVGSEGHFFRLEKAPQVLDASGMAHFAQRLGLDLTDALARNLVLFADFFQGALIAVFQAKPQLEDFSLT